MDTRGSQIAPAHMIPRLAPGACLEICYRLIDPASEKRCDSGIACRRRSNPIELFLGGSTHPKNIRRADLAGPPARNVFESDEAPIDGPDREPTPDPLEI